MAIKEIKIPTLPLTLSDHQGKWYFVRQARKMKRVSATSSIHVGTLWGSVMAIIIKRFTYTVGDERSRASAIKKAIAYCVGTTKAETYFV